MLSHASSVGYHYRLKFICTSTNNIFLINSHLFLFEFHKFLYECCFYKKTSPFYPINFSIIFAQITPNKLSKPSHNNIHSFKQSPQSFVAKVCGGKVEADWWQQTNGKLAWFFLQRSQKCAFLQMDQFI